MTKTFKSAIVGMKFHEGADKILAEAPDGMAVTLVREPDNEFDPSAIAVHVDGIKCGFVPRAQSERLAEDLDNGTPVTAMIEGHAKLEITVEVDEEEGEET